MVTSLPVGDRLTLSSPIPPSIHPSTRPTFLPFFSGPQHFLDQISRHAVEEEAQHDEQQQGQHDLDDQPLVAVAHQVADGFQRAQEPEKGGVWATGGREIKMGEQEKKGRERRKGGWLVYLNPGACVEMIDRREQDRRDGKRSRFC